MKLTVTLPSVLLFCLEAPASAEELKWLPDYPSAQAAARASGKPVFLVFR